MAKGGTPYARLVPLAAPKPRVPGILKGKLGSLPIGAFPVRRAIS
jgi:hypothetical protein